MNKQQLIKEIHKIVGEHCFDKLQVQDGWFNWLWLEKQINELDEPSREECRLIANEYNICSCCSYNLDNLIEEIVVGCDTEDCDCGRAVVHQIFWTDKYMNYCPNCGSKIKRR